MKISRLFSLILSGTALSLTAFAGDYETQSAGNWFCLAQDRPGSNYSSGFTDTLGGAQKQALEFCYSFSEMPATCRVLSCEEINP